MPFTFAHPAAVLPIKNKWDKYFDLTGLTVTSIKYLSKDCKSV
ncbi:DUF4184 family protein [Tissierella sp. MSJ-40]|uniref:DUF4184 family protein n=1 Tax=Tissierella simiarum TaxID=2841534 RepID=A0ABS6E2X4_9FIRM|nr:DUF4184 family protein [Tissierella simiarum]MBU5437127.1 DUF4184 family protein [Tissierella simiarum]